MRTLLSFCVQFNHLCKPKLKPIVKLLALDYFDTPELSSPRKHSASYKLLKFFEFAFFIMSFFIGNWFYFLKLLKHRPPRYFLKSKTDMPFKKLGNLFADGCYMRSVPRNIGFPTLKYICQLHIHW